MARVTRGKGYQYTSMIPEFIKKERKETLELANRTAVGITTAAVKRASGRPGPNVDTGKLRRKIQPQLAELRIANKIRAAVRSLAPYSLYLEKGTVKMQPYPFMVPALMGYRQKLFNDIQQTFERLTRGT